jgi:hypothetical protein
LILRAIWRLQLKRLGINYNTDRPWNMTEK